MIMVLKWDELSELVKEDCLGYPDNLDKFPALINVAEEFFKKCEMCMSWKPIRWQPEVVAKQGEEIIASLHGYRKNLEQWQTQINKREKTFKFIDSVIEETKRESETAIQDLAIAKGIVEETNEELQQCQQLLGEKRDGMAGMNSKCEQLKIKHNDLQTEHTALQGRSAELDHNNKSQQEALEQCETQIGKLNDEKMQLTAKIAELTAQRDHADKGKLANDQQELTRKLQQLEQDRLAIATENERLIWQRSFLNQRYGQLDQAHRQEVFKGFEAKRYLEQNIAGLIMQLDEVENTVSSLLVTLDSFTGPQGWRGTSHKQKTDLREDVNRLWEQLANRGQGLAMAKSSAESRERKLEEFRQREALWTREKQDLLERITALGQEAEIARSVPEKDAEIEDLRSQNREWEKKYDEQGKSIAFVVRHRTDWTQVML